MCVFLLFDLFRLLELLSLNVDGETVECFVASRENNVFLPKSDTLNYLREISADLGAAFKDSDIVYDYDPCSSANPCLNGGKCSSRVVVTKKTELAESGDVIFNSPAFVQVSDQYQKYCSSHKKYQCVKRPGACSIKLFSR